MPFFGSRGEISPALSRGVRSNASAGHSTGTMFLKSVESFGDRPAVFHKVKGSYTPVTFKELYQQVILAARGLLELALKTGDRLAILSENRPEWLHIDLACQLLGITDVPIYPSLPSNQVEYILQDSACRAIIVSDRSQLKKIIEAWPRLPALETVITMEAQPSEVEGSPSLPQGSKILSLDAVKTGGAASTHTEDEVRKISSEVDADDLASIVYTSGTTGDPKGAMLTHRNFMSNAEAVSQLLRIGPSDTFLSFLPLNHVFERLAGYYFPLSCGSPIYYAESALRVKYNLPEVQPAVLIGVPRLYDALCEGVHTAIGKATPGQQRIFDLATALGRDRMWALQAEKKPSLLNDILWAAVDVLVLQKVRTKIGCSRIRYLVSGSAPLPRATAEFMYSVGVPYLEGYGLTETAPVISVNTPEAFRVGSVGRAIPGVEIKIADDGEILSRGPHIMKGYLNKPEATAEAIDSHGWFHTGDIGHIDDDGFLFITDRKKDLLVLATGKKVAPQPIEARLKASPYIREVVVLGDHLSSCVALVVPALDQLRDYAKKQGWSFTGDITLCALPEAKKFIRSEIDRNSEGLAEYERIRNLALLDKEFTVDSGELTPTLKVKRKVVAANYADVIKGLAG